ncbi:lipoate--protein ligase family protein [Candidatus Bipolaricaulota bacterium]|nr:lipoate--protein ligase family protein [Candidatus Bipolaricaulota bacterium]
MRLLTDLVPTEPAWGLAIEEVLLDSARKERVETIRIWQNQHAIILGRAQSLAAEVDVARALEQDIPILRRISGGGTVFHYPGNLNVSVFANKRSKTSDVASVFAFFGQSLSNALASFLPVHVSCQDNGLYLNGKKVGGAAQARRGSAVLYHSTILVQPSPVPMEQLLRAMGPGYCASGIASRPRAMMTLSEHVSRSIEPQELVQPIVHALACALGVGVRPGTLTAQEIECAEQLKKTKYGSPTWNARM